VTGASSGIGESIARVAARDGHDLVLVARGADALARLADDLARDHGVSAETLPADLADADGLASVAARLGDRERPVEIVVNNAGRGTGGPFAELPVEGELAQIDLNVTALVRLTHAALAVMVPRRHGGVLNVASLGGFQPAPFNATYSATKAFVLSFTEAVHEEVRTAGVHVSCLCPGFTRTGFQAASGLDASGLPDYLWQSADEVAEAAWYGLGRNQAVVVPGAVNKATATGVRFLPRVAVRRLAGRIAGSL